MWKSGLILATYPQFIPILISVYTSAILCLSRIWLGLALLLGRESREVPNLFPELAQSSVAFGVVGSKGHLNLFFEHSREIPFLVMSSLHPLRHPRENGNPDKSKTKQNLIFSVLFWIPN